MDKRKGGYPRTIGTCPICAGKLVDHDAREAQCSSCGSLVPKSEIEERSS